MRTWIGYSSFSILFLSVTFLISLPRQARSQFRNDYIGSRTLFQEGEAANYSSPKDTTDLNGKLPDPKSVMHKSMIIPGWGQIVNKQAWKVPIVYGLLGGVAYYSIYLTKKYHDYRAAYYNLDPQQTNNDFRFGQTPSYISKNANVDQLKTIRNTYRNRRDMAYIGVALAYGLNIIDAYVYAHMRSFDVSKDLSMRARIKPGITSQATPGMTLSIDLITR